MSYSWRRNQVEDRSHNWAALEKKWVYSATNNNWRNQVLKDLSTGTHHWTQAEYNAHNRQIVLFERKNGEGHFFNWIPNTADLSHAFTINSWSGAKFIMMGYWRIFINILTSSTLLISWQQDRKRQDRYRDFLSDETCLVSNAKTQNGVECLYPFCWPLKFLLQSNKVNILLSIIDLIIHTCNIYGIQHLLLIWGHANFHEKTISVPNLSVFLRLRSKDGPDRLMLYSLFLLLSHYLLSRRRELMSQ